MGAYVPKIGEVVEAVGNGLELRYSVGAKLFIEGKVIGYLANMDRDGECVGSGRVVNQVMGG